jgi:hypothetical protein
MSLIVQQQIQIQGPRSPAHGSNPALRGFERLQRRQQFIGRQHGIQGGDGVDVIRLTRGGPPTGAVRYSGDGPRSGGRKFVARLAMRAALEDRVIQIAADADVGPCTAAYGFASGNSGFRDGGAPMRPLDPRSGACAGGEVLPFLALRSRLGNAGLAAVFFIHRHKPGPPVGQFPAGFVGLGPQQQKIVGGAEPGMGQQVAAGACR